MDEHADDFPKSNFKFHVLERANAGTELDVAEESWMRRGGGAPSINPDTPLSNRRVEMSEENYRAAGGTVPLPSSGGK